MESPNERECWWCGKELQPDEKVCNECAAFVAKNGYMPGAFDREDDTVYYCDYCGEEIKSPVSKCLHCGGGGLG